MKKRILILFLTVLFLLPFPPTAEASCSHARSLTASGGTLSGNYYLSADTKLTQNVTIGRGSSTLCLTGHTLDLNQRSITVPSGATLTIRDCAGSGTIVITNPDSIYGSINVEKGGTLHITGGRMRMDATASCYGYGIANNGGTMNISDGTFTADIFTDYSGNYSINLALVYAGAGTTNITGGSFTANVLPPSSGTARAICAWVSGGTLNITGGSFTGDNYSSMVSRQRCPYPILVQSDDLYLGGSPDIYGIVCLYSFYGPSYLLHAKSTSGENYTGSAIQLGCINGSYSSHKLLVDDVTKGINEDKFQLSSQIYSGNAQLKKDHLVYYTSNSTDCSVRENESDDGVITTQPTCTSYGTKTYTCQTCYSTRSELVSKKPHTNRVLPAVPPSCTESGLSEGLGCYYCGLIETAQEIIPPLGHSEVKDPAVEATCGKEGRTEGSHCEICKTVITKPSVIPATGEHQYDLDEGMEPTCTEPGLTAGSSCHACGYVHVAQEDIPAAGHTEIADPGIPPTCTATGLSDGSHCSACHTILIAQETLPMSAHTPVIDSEVEATCSSTGLTQGSHCRDCGTILLEQMTIPRKPHSVVIDPPVLPTCTDTGREGTGMHCSDCGTILLAQTEVPPLGHTYQAAATPPTCTEAGYSTHTCSRCNNSYVSNSVDALGHREVIDEAVDATCTQSGLTTGSHCGRCGQVLVPQTKTSPLAHMYKKTVTLPTCTEAGYTTYICTRCQDSYTADHTESLGHRYGGPIFSWSETLSQATAARVCPCGEEISAQCTLSWDDSKPGKLTITATAELENQVFTDSKEILSSIKQDVITISLPCEVPGLHITAAAYGPSGQMTNLLIPELADDSLTKTFPFSGDTIRLFFLDSQWIPLFPALTLP